MCGKGAQKLGHECEGSQKKDQPEREGCKVCKRRAILVCVRAGEQSFSIFLSTPSIRHNYVPFSELGPNPLLSSRLEAGGSL